jgi:membrane fusion protein (multidrug efflux system)
MRSLTRLVTVLVLATSLLAAGCSSESSEADQTPEPPAEKAVPVKVAQVEARDIEERFTLPGSLKAWEDLTLAAEIAGTVDSVGPREGQWLKAGQVILTIDSVTQKANLEKARVDAEVKRSAMERLDRLVEDNLVSKQEYDNSVTAFEAARQNYELARIALDKSSVRAPISGVLDARFVERGEYVKVGNPVAEIVQVDRLKVLVDVPEKDVRYLELGEEVSVIQSQIDTGETLQRTGKLVHLAYKADPVTRTYRAKIEVHNKDRDLRPGMIVRIEARRRTLEDAIAVPLYAVVDLDGRKVVFVEEQGKARLRPVKIGRALGDQLLIREGLKAGERLIVKGQQLLKEGAPVAVGEG